MEEGRAGLARPSQCNKVDRTDVIANQSSDWCGDLPNIGEALLYSIDHPLYREIAKPVFALARNDGIF